LLSLSGISTQAQQEAVKESESVIVMSEDDIISLAMTLRELKKKYANKAPLNLSDTSNTEISTLEKNSFEVAYLKKQIVLLENQIKESTTSKNTTDTNATLIKDSNSLNQTELNGIKQDINQLKDLIRQLAIKTNNDLTVVVPSGRLETKTEVVPIVTTIKEQIPSNEKENIALKRKVDSLNVLFKNFKASDYSGDFAALEKRISELKKELALKDLVLPTSFENLTSEYKGYSRSIYFSNNSTNLNEEGIKVVDELNKILDKNNNIDIVVKGFASNKGVALYNENLSMMRTESVKKALILKGIHPIRVLTQYHGIDYEAKADKARRVEISILVRK
jgi:outer membrane protein OmpA-like peptidoglycan-associated protein